MAGQDGGNGCIGAKRCKGFVILGVVSERKK